MICERCKKNEATIQIMERNSDGNVSIHHYCDSCFSELGQGDFSDTDWSTSLSKFLADILGGTEENPDQKRMSQIACPTCGMTYGEFVHQNLFGCADCYEAFGPIILGNIKQIQGADSHIGKKPKFWYEEGSGSEYSVSGKRDITSEEKRILLQTKLKEAVAMEEYDLAAKYRDEIKELSDKK